MSPTLIGVVGITIAACSLGVAVYNIWLSHFRKKEPERIEEPPAEAPADEGSFGPDHPNVAVDLNNLAQLLKATNRLAEAEPLIRRALAIFEASLGKTHPNTIGVRRNLEILLQEMKG
ncbi:MAG: tetratricopeptide repeat protein [Acidobacteriota bacterium]|nr:tetratricopeptide repeat protein [Acidobacteriota bacterium]